jgi:hypothetical protein
MKEPRMSWEEIQCANCGIKFYLETSVYERWYESGKKFFCPNGHSVSFVTKEDDASFRDKFQAAVKENELLTKRIAELTLELEIWKPANADSHSEK